jgi:phosphoglycerate dehydrogenase-like enzyme
VTPAVVVNKGHYGGFLVPALEASAPGERFVLCSPGDAVPEEADTLVTLVEASAGLTSLLTDGIRWVHALGAGVDGFPLAEMGDRIVTCSRGASAVPIAEWVLAVMLAHEKQLPEMWLSAPPERWSSASLGTLAGRTVGIVGLGAIGTEVARRALAFDMNVLAVRRTSRPVPLAGIALAPDVADLAARVDHLVIAAPSTPDTARLVDRRVLAAARPGLHLVNISRGALLDQEALVAALDDGTVGRASLDVAEPEPLPAGHPLYEHPLVRLSAHVSWSAPTTLERTVELFVENLRRWRNHEELVGVVDHAAGY